MGSLRNLRRRKVISESASSTGEYAIALKCGVRGKTGAKPTPNPGRGNPHRESTKSWTRIFDGIASACPRLAIDPQRYLTQLLTNLPATPVGQIEQWLPNELLLGEPSPPG